MYYYSNSQCPMFIYVYKLHNLCRYSISTFYKAIKFIFIFLKNLMIMINKIKTTLQKSRLIPLIPISFPYMYYYLILTEHVNLFIYYEFFFPRIVSLQTCTSHIFTRIFKIDIGLFCFFEQKFVKFNEYHDSARALLCLVFF